MYYFTKSYCFIIIKFSVNHSDVLQGLYFNFTHTHIFILITISFSLNRWGFFYSTILMERDSLGDNLKLSRTVNHPTADKLIENGETTIK